MWLVMSVIASEGRPCRNTCVRSLHWMLTAGPGVRAQGSSFDEVCKLCLLYEGSIIRATRRLDELMRQLEVQHHSDLCLQPGGQS